MHMHTAALSTTLLAVLAVSAVVHASTVGKTSTIGRSHGRKDPRRRAMTVADEVLKGALTDPLPPVPSLPMSRYYATTIPLSMDTQPPPPPVPLLHSGTTTTIVAIPDASIQPPSVPPVPLPRNDATTAITLSTNTQPPSVPPVPLLRSGATTTTTITSTATVQPPSVPPVPLLRNGATTTIMTTPGTTILHPLRNGPTTTTTITSKLSPKPAQYLHRSRSDSSLRRSSADGAVSSRLTRTLSNDGLNKGPAQQHKMPMRPTPPIPMPTARHLPVPMSSRPRTPPSPIKTPSPPISSKQNDTPRSTPSLSNLFGLWREDLPHKKKSEKDLFKQYVLTEDHVTWAENVIDIIQSKYVPERNMNRTPASAANIDALKKEMSGTFPLVVVNNTNFDVFTMTDTLRNVIGASKDSPCISIEHRTALFEAGDALARIPDTVNEDYANIRTQVARMTVTWRRLLMHIIRYMTYLDGKVETTTVNKESLCRMFGAMFFGRILENEDPKNLAFISTSMTNAMGAIWDAAMKYPIIQKPWEAILEWK